MKENIADHPQVSMPRVRACLLACPVTGWQKWQPDIVSKLLRGDEIQDDGQSEGNCDEINEN